MHRRDNLEEQTDRFLAEHDPFYREKRRNKGRRLDYSYLTKSQLRKIRQMEIPFSALGDRQAHKVLNANVETALYREVKEQ